MTQIKKTERAFIKSQYNVMGIAHPLRSDYLVKGIVKPGTTIHCAIRKACDAAKINRNLIRYGIAQVGIRDYKKQKTVWKFVPFSQWKKYRLKKDELLRFRILPQGGGGGGGGKSVLNSILSVVVAVAAVVASVFTAGATLPLLGAAGSMIAGGLAGMAVMTIGMALTNAIAPVAQPSLASFSNRSQNQEQTVYSISAGRNSINQWGRVPVPVGRGRFAPPKAASSYTQLKGDDQYLHELFCLGIGDMDITNVKIGSTPIENFTECLYEIMTYDPKNPKSPLYYQNGVYEETLNIKLEKDITNIRTTQYCDKAEIDFSFQGLCWLNDRGNPEKTDVCFNIQYKKDDGEAWTDVGQSKYIKGVSNKRLSETGKYLVGVNLNGIFFRKDATTIGDKEVQLGFVEHSISAKNYTNRVPTGGTYTGPDSSVQLEYREDHVSYTYHIYKFTKSIKKNGLSIDGFNVKVQNGVYYGKYDSELKKNNKQAGISVSSGNITTISQGASDIDKFCITGSQTSLLRKTYTINFPEKGIYAISIIRKTDDTTDTRLRNESYWTALRSISDELPIKTDYPVMLLSLQVKASGQLSGAIENLTVYYETKCWNYDMAAQKWEWEYTSNPAAIMRYILQQKDAFSRPQTDDMIDLQSFIDAYKYYDSFPFSYDKVLDGSISVFERLVTICASALSSPTMLEGKWGIIVDKPRENVICAFTSANSWNWSFERTQIRLPNAIHCNFVNEETWDADMRVVMTDEADTGNYLYETQEYDGVVDPQQVYLLARFHYADAKMRRRTISFKCYDEALLCTRGDLVELACPNISVQGLQVGRIRKVTTNDDGQVVSFTTDQINTTDFSGRRFGVKIYNVSGKIFHAEIKPEDKSKRELVLASPQTMEIANGDKYAFGDYSEEVFQAIILSMKPNSDKTWDIVCQDYIPAIYGDLSKPIPEWTSVITRPIEFKWQLTSTPIIVGIVSDESAIIYGSDGSLQCRILIYLKDPRDLDSRAKYYQAQYRQVQDDSDPDNIIYGQWLDAGYSVPIEQSRIYIDNVSEGYKYQIRVRYAGVAGEHGDWCEIVEHIVVGKTNIPPDVTGFKARIKDPEGIELSWDMLKILDIAHYKIGGASSNIALASPSIEKVYNRTGILDFNIVAVDTGGRQSAHPAYAEVEVFPPADPVLTSAKLLNPGIVAEWLDAKTTWTIDRYILEACGIIVNADRLTATIPFIGKFDIGSYVNIRCIDIFNNASESAGSRIITVYYPQTPKIKFGFNKLNGNITLDWQDCTNQTVANAPSIDHYVVTGTLAMGGGVSVKGTHYESIVPLIVYEFGAGSIEGGIPVNVGNLHIKVNAVDKYGITSEDAPDYVSNEINIEIRPPYNPTDFGVSASLTTGENLEANWTEATAIMLTWRDCERTFAIDYYLVYDYFTGTQYKVATNYVVLPARKEGSYKITVQAFDILGLSSANMEYNLTIAGVGGMEVRCKIDGADILLEWDTPPASFQIDHYLIFEDNDDIPDGTNADLSRDGYMGQAKVNYFRTPAKELGTFTFYVWAVDVAGNINSNFANYTSVTILGNPAPTISAKLAGNGVELSWKINNKPNNTLPVQSWDIRRYEYIADIADITNYTELQNYGRISTDKLNVDAFLAGKYTFVVRAIDTAGREGAWGKVDFTATVPGQVRFVNSVVIDNNVQLYWTEPVNIFFPIKEYIFDEVDKDTGIHMRIGTVDALFASEVEEEAGEYIYAITPVDWGGNLGATNTIKLRVSQPPDFVFYDNKDSLFNGTKTNLVLDGKGSMLGPVPVGETWEQNVSRMKTLAGKDILTHKGKNDAGWPYWLQPEVNQGIYTEVIDHGAIVPSSNYRVSIDYVILKQKPVITCKIEISKDNKTWEVVSDNATSVYVAQFRYSRITITVTGGFVKITRINYKLDVKKLTDFGRVLSNANDNGSGWTSESATPMLTGTWVPFKVNFVDVQSLPRPNVVVKNSMQSSYTAFTVFEDVLNPKGFRVFVKDKNGNRVTAEVDWVAMGV